VAKVARAAENLGLKAEPAFPSPLKGPKGNQEYFLYVTLSKDKPAAA
jgi:predicted rRNA methylase YqxC with S4 and FtsJ domains